MKILVRTISAISLLLSCKPVNEEQSGTSSFVGNGVSNRHTVYFTAENKNSDKRCWYYGKKQGSSGEGSLDGKVVRISAGAIVSLKDAIEGATTGNTSTLCPPSVFR